jgi:hypothetical protein
LPRHLSAVGPNPSLDSLESLPESGDKGKLVGQKAPLRLRDIWAIRIRIQLTDKIRDLALLNPAIDSKLRACDLVTLRVRDIAPRSGIRAPDHPRESFTH